MKNKLSFSLEFTITRYAYYALLVSLLIFLGELLLLRSKISFVSGDGLILFICFLPPLVSVISILILGYSHFSKKLKILNYFGILFLIATTIVIIFNIFYLFISI